MSDTHASGERGEQWEKRQHDDRAPYLYIPPGPPHGEFPLGITMPEWMIDAILAAHAQAGLAQRYREALDEADLRFSAVHNLVNDLSDDYSEHHFQVAADDFERVRILAVAAREDIASRLRALTAGREETAWPTQLAEMRAKNDTDTSAGL